MALSRNLIGALANTTRGQQTAADLLLEQSRSQLAQGQVADEATRRKAQELFGRSLSDLLGSAPQPPMGGGVPQSPAPGQPSVPMGAPAPVGAPMAAAGGAPGAASPMAAPPAGTAGGPAPMPGPQGPPSPLAMPSMQQQSGGPPSLADMPPPATTNLSWDKVIQSVKMHAPDASGDVLAKVAGAYAPLIQQQQQELWERAKFKMQLDDKQEARADRLFMANQTIQQRMAEATLRSEDRNLSMEQRADYQHEMIDLRAEAQRNQLAIAQLVNSGKNDRAAAGETGRMARAQMVNDRAQRLQDAKLPPEQQMAFKRLSSARAQAEAGYREALYTGNAKVASQQQELVNGIDEELDNLDKQVRSRTPAAPAAPTSTQAPAPGGNVPAKPAGVPPAAGWSPSKQQWWMPDGSQHWGADGKPGE